MSKHHPKHGPRAAVAEYSRGFLVMEATSFQGGFPAYMNMIMAAMVEHMVIDGHAGPYSWSFSGGDGYASPVFLHCRDEK